MKPNDIRFKLTNVSMPIKAPASALLHQRTRPVLARIRKTGKPTTSVGTAATATHSNHKPKLMLIVMPSGMSVWGVLKWSAIFVHVVPATIKVAAVTAAAIRARLTWLACSFFGSWTL